MADDKRVLVNEIETEHGSGGSSSGATQPSAPPLANNPPPYTPASPNNPVNTGGDGPIYTEESPPPYSPNQTILCKVCRAVLNITPGSNTNIIKCPACQESTAIRPAPPGKKYIRCPCNCLLICNADSTRVMCPRTNCSRTLVTRVTVVAGNSGNTVRRRCAHCNTIIRIRAGATLVRCSACSRTSWIDPSVKKMRVAVWCSIGALFLVAGIIVTAVTIALAAHGGTYVIWIGAFIAGVVNLIRAGYLASFPTCPPVEAGA